MVNRENLVDVIIDFESGDITIEKTLELFSFLIKDGMVWQLQGSYGRTAMDLIENDIIDRNGNINWTKINEGEIV